jgi:hypothetical protein
MIAMSRSPTYCRSSSRLTGNRTAILRSKKSYETGPTAAPISAARFRHSTNSAARLSPAFQRSANRLQRHLPRVPLISCFRPQNCGAVSRCSARPGQVPTIARLSRFYNKFCLQRDRSTTYAKRAADCKLARLTCHPRRICGAEQARGGMLPQCGATSLTYPGKRLLAASRRMIAKIRQRA